MRKIGLSAVILAVSAALMFTHPAAADSTASDDERSSEIEGIMEVNPGSRQISETEVELEPGVIMTVPSSGEVTAQASCSSGYVCFWEHVNHGGYSIGFYHCALRSLDRYFMPNGDDWAFDISSWIDSQTGGTYATLYGNELSYLTSTRSPRNQPWVGSRINDRIVWVDVCNNA
jgi:hypothetical protein